MFTVKRAIIIAAGFGSRMGALTQDTPKPMLKVHGERIIDNTIRKLIENGIEEIHVVVGYHKERFQEVKEVFPQIDLIENPYFETCNNISSLYVARDYLEECMILEGDQYFFSAAPLAREFEHTEYNAFWVNEPSVEWIAEVDQKGRITVCHENGADRGWLFYGVSRWTSEDGRKLKRCLEYEFEINNTRNCYWDRVPVFLYPEQFEIFIRKGSPYDRVELDNIRELAAVDDHYAAMLEVRT